MELLIFTQKVDKDDSVLGFFHSWLLEFAKYFGKIIVICLEKGNCDLPENVKILSLGKEEYSHHSHIIRRFVSLFRFYKYIWQERKNYDAVFIHMNPEYLVLGGWLWKIMDKKTSLWYVHRQLNWRIKIAEKMADRVFSVSGNTFPFKSGKLRAMGHGIDTEKFKCERKIGAGGEIKIKTPVYNGFADISLKRYRRSIISVGRITKIKNLDILIKAAKIIKGKIDTKFAIDIIGAPATSQDNEYLLFLKDLAKKEGVNDIVRFQGAVEYGKMVDVYCQSHISVNLCPTGGIDKAVLESMSCEIPVLVSNESFIPYFSDLAQELIFKYRNENNLADKIVNLIENQNEARGEFLRKQVEKEHNLKTLIKKLSEEISNG